MFKVIQINRKTGATQRVGKLYDSMQKADGFAIRCSFAESNPNVIYMVLIS